MTNLYWPVYQNLERAVDELSFSIHIDDAQLGVYSSQITDLILRAAAEVESISKDLYKANGGPKTGELRYDDDAIKHLNNLWLLDHKVVLISSPNCFQSSRILLPFVKNETRTNSSKQTYSWNNAYQNLKHDRANSMAFGSIKYLFDIMAALYLLNVYYRDEIFEIGTDTSGTNFDVGVGSHLFSVHVSRYPMHTGPLLSTYVKQADFDQATYFINWSVETAQREREKSRKFQEALSKRIEAHPKTKEFRATYPGDVQLPAPEVLLGHADFSRAIKAAVAIAPMQPSKVCKYEAILNKNQTPL